MRGGIIMAGTWFHGQTALLGLKNSFGVAGLVLCASSIGVGALAHDAGIGVLPLLIMTFFTWALPSQVILIAMMASGAGLIATALAVSLSAVRLMPMVTSMIPTIRNEDTPRWILLVIAHMTAATVWLEARRQAPTIPLEKRAVYILFMSLGLISMLMVGVMVGFHLASQVPVLISAALIFITPIYFLVAMFSAAQIKADYISIGLGFAFGPPITYLLPELDLMIAGLIGGSLAYGFFLLFEKGKEKAA